MTRDDYIATFNEYVDDLVSKKKRKKKKND